MEQKPTGRRRGSTGAKMDVLVWILLMCVQFVPCCVAKPIGESRLSFVTKIFKFLCVIFL
jgi:hypothetical protein